MSLKQILAMAPLALGTAYAGCYGLENEVYDEQAYALNGESNFPGNLERVDPNATAPRQHAVLFEYSFFLPLVPELVPAPEVEIENAYLEHYAVEGSDCEEAKADMETKGYVIDGEWRAGKTETQFGFNCGYTPVPGEADREHRKFCCSAVVEGLTAYCDATVYLPQWDGISRCWDRFIDGLTTHEQGHVDICQDYAGRLNDAIIGLTSSVCSAESMAKACDEAVADLEQKAESAYDEVNADYNAADDAYDAETNHGETQGARLDCNCE